MFNREFYCVHTFDNETTCNGLLFYGSTFSPIIQLDSNETDRLNTLIAVLSEEFETRDTNQEEMLRLLLKRFIIRCTRVARKQYNLENLDNQDVDLIRHFNVLVEEHFRKLKSVTDYASLLNKSPKTIANAFSKFSDETPLHVIHNRIILEAKRLLIYTNKSAKEIGIELGYFDPAQFSKFFKLKTGVTMTEFKSGTTSV